MSNVSLEDIERYKRRIKAAFVLFDKEEQNTVIVE
jgi:hypothetical protein